MPEKSKNDKRVKVQVVEEKPVNDNPQTEIKESEDKAEEQNLNISAENVDIDIEKAEKVEVEVPDEKEKEVDHKKEIEKEKIEEPVVKDKIEPENKEKIPFWVLFFAFLVGLSLGAGLIGGIFYYRSNVNPVSVPEETYIPVASPSMNDEQPEPTPDEEQTTQETPKPTVDLSKYKIQVLNGSGIAGSAGKVETLLKNSGFKNITVGNAGTYNYTDTVVSEKDTVESAIYSEIEKSLSNYNLKQGDPLKSSNTYDIVIIVGKPKS